MNKLVVVGDIGMEHHAKLFAESYGFDYALTKNAQQYQNIFQFGVYSEDDYRNIINRTEGKIRLHWCGTDVLMYKRRINRRPFKFPMCIEHTAQSDRQVKLLSGCLDKEVKVVPCFSDKRENYPLTSLPEKFSVLILTPRGQTRYDLFCFDTILKVIRECPDINFVFVGSASYLWSGVNIEQKGWVSLTDAPNEYRNILKNCSCLLRFTRGATDGFSQMITQMLLLGRYVVSNLEQEYIENVNCDNVQLIVQKLRELKELKDPYIKASEYYHKRTDINNFDFLNG